MFYHTSNILDFLFYHRISHLMNDSMKEKLASLARRLEEIDATLQDPDIASDMNRFRSLTKERADIEPVVNKSKEYQKAEEDLQAAEAMLSDPDLKEFASEEISNCKELIAKAEDELRVLLLPKDPNDDKNIFLEIRAGTGGDESALFAGDLFRMYSRYAERQKWQVEFVSATESDLGGYKEIVVRIIGQGAYSKLKFESGGHRVQRVPETESQGRVHTSACTVAVLPEQEEERSGPRASMLFPVWIIRTWQLSGKIISSIILPVP